MVAGLVISIPLFANQTEYTGLVPKANGNFGDLTALVGFVVAAVVYGLLSKRLSSTSTVA